jgi:hypothetical protein
MKHPIRKSVTFTIENLTLAELKSLIAATGDGRTPGLRRLHRGLDRALRSVDWIPKLEADHAAAGLLAW